MNVIQNKNVAFRCPNTLKEKLQRYAEENDLRVSAVIRAACSGYLKEQAPHLFWNPPSVVAGGGSTASGWLVNTGRS